MTLEEVNDPFVYIYLTEVNNILFTFSDVSSPRSMTFFTFSEVKTWGKWS